MSGLATLAELEQVPLEDPLGRRLVGRVVVRLYILFLSHPVSFPFLFSLQHPLFSSLFSRENSVEIVNFLALSRV